MTWRDIERELRIMFEGAEGFHVDDAGWISVEPLCPHHGSECRMIGRHAISLSDLARRIERLCR